MNINRLLWELGFSKLFHVILAISLEKGKLPSLFALTFSYTEKEEARVVRVFRIFLN